MKRTLLLAAGAVIAAVAIWVTGCGGGDSGGGACQDLYLDLCACESDKKAQDDCAASVEKLTFTADENAACSEKKTTCTCATLKSEDTAKANCPANADIVGG